MVDAYYSRTLNNNLRWSETFCFRWGFLSRAGLWDKSHLMRQIEKYVVMPQKSYLDLKLKELCYWIIVNSGMLIYTHLECPIFSIIRPSCIFGRKSRYGELLNELVNTGNAIRRTLILRLFFCRHLLMIRTRIIVQNRMDLWWTRSETWDWWFMLWWLSWW